MSDDTPKQSIWIESIKTLGLPTVLLVTVLIMLWRAGKYISTDVIKPMLESHLQFVKESTETLEQIQTNGRDALIRIDNNTTETLRILKDKQ